MRINITLCESYPETMDSPQSVSTNICADLEGSNVHAYYKVFEKILAHAGFNEEQIMRGATELGFNEFRDTKLMEKVGSDYGLLLEEQLHSKLKIQQDKLPEV